MKSDTSGVTTHDFEPAGELSPTGQGPTVQIGADSGTFKADGTFRGHAGEDVPAEDPALCRLLGA